MSNLDKLVAKGAYSCGGELLFKNKVMGQLRYGEFFISVAGKAELEISDVEAKEVKPRAKKVKTEATVEAAGAVEITSVEDDLQAMQDLLGE